MAMDPLWSAPGGGPVAISADGGFVLSDGDSFGLYDATGNTTWRGYGGSSARSGSLITSPLDLTADGMYAILATNGGLLYVDRSRRIFWQDSAYHPILDLSLSPDENFVASVADGRVSVYTRGGDLVWRNSTYSDVQTVAISSEGLLTVAGATDTIHAYNRTGFELWNYTAPGVHRVLLSPENSDIIAASEYTLLSLHPSGNLLWKVYTGDEIRAVAISRDGSTIAAGNQGGSLLLLDRDGTQLFSRMLGNWVNTVSLSGDGSLVAAGDIDRKVHLLDRNGRQLFNYTTGGIVQGIAVSTDGSALAAGSDRVYYFDLRQPVPATTPVPPPVATATLPVTTPAPATSPPVTTGPTTPAGTVPAVTTTRSAAGPWAIPALGILFLWFALRRGR